MNTKAPLGFAIFIAVWFIVSESGVIDPLFMESPVSVFQKISELFVSGSILPDLGLTLGRMFLGFIISIAIGVPAGIALGYSKTAYQIFEPLVDFVRSVPATALFPLFLLFFGIGDMSKIAVVVFGATFLILIGSMYGIHHSSKTRILLARTFGANQLTVFRKVVFFEALPHIFVGLRLAVSLSLVLIVVSEMFLTGSIGLGSRIFNAHLVYNIPEMYAVIIITGVIGYLLNVAMLRAERKIAHWAGKQ